MQTIKKKHGEETVSPRAFKYIMGINPNKLKTDIRSIQRTKLYHQKYVE